MIACRCTLQHNIGTAVFRNPDEGSRGLSNGVYVSTKHSHSSDLYIEGEALAHDGELFVGFVAVHFLVPVIKEGGKVDKCTSK